MAAPELRLNVTLDLAAFRTQLGKLAQTSASHFYPVKLTIDQRNFKLQLAQLSKIKPVININDSQLDGARTRIGTLNKSLATLRRATVAPIEIKLKYVEVGKPPSAAAGQIGQAVSGRIRADQAVAALNRKQAVAARNMLKAANVPVGGLGTGRSLDAYRKSITEGMAKAGKESIAGLAQGLKDGQSAIGQAAKIVGDEGVRAIKATLGIASPSRVFKQIGEFSVDGLEIGFLNGLKGFKSKSLAEIRKIVALMQFELAKVSGVSMAPGMSRSAGSRGSNQFMSPIGPLPEGSQEPWAFSQYRYQPFLAQPGQTRGAGVPPMRQRFPFLPEPPVMGTTVSSPGMYGASFPALPPAGGTAATRETMLAMRELEARVRSAARAASVFAEDMVSAGRRNVLPPAGGGSGTAIVPHRSFVGPTSRQAIPMGAGGGALVPYAGGGGNVPPVPPPGGGGGGFPSDGMRGPSTQLGAGYYEAGKGLKGIQSAYGQAKKFLDTSRFPVTGAITGLGNEFGNAIKQVLLFGTAYKALAFLTSLPGEAFEAAKGLATYKNQLQAVTAESGTFEQSFAFVDGLAARFNVPLDSARQGFIKLYASMEPAGFDQGQIEGLFTGISKASAAFGLSADKVDRVNYAFAQMASKGQIMSEELKGQLGDVLPGALGLFAEAAQMSIPEFSKAMEDGAFKGKAMEQVLGNVSILLNTKFGPAAEGAAKTLQGAVNQIQNNLSLMYQAFAPIVDGVAAAFGPQVNSLIKDVTDTVKVLTTTLAGGGDGFDTLSPRAQAFYAAVQTLEPALRQAGAALTDLGSRLAALAPYFVQVLASVISFASSPLARAALIAALAIGTLTAAMKLLEVTGIKAVLKSIYTFIGTLTTGIPVASGIARVAVIGLKLAITGLFIGAVLIGLDFLVGKLLRIGDAANDSAKDLRGMAKELDRMAGAGDLEGLTGEFLSANTRLAAARKANQQALKDLGAAKARPEGNTQADISKGVAVANAQTKVDQTYTKVIEAQKEVQAARRSRDNAVTLKERQDAAAEEEAKKGLQKIDLSGGDAAKTKNKQKYVSDMAKLLQQEMQQKINAINQDASISDREREIQAAATRYDYELLMNKAEYNAGINDENKKDILNRGQYLADLQKTLKAENELSRQRYENIVTSPLRDMLSEDKKAIIELEATEKMISEGRTERTQVEQREIEIKQALVGLDEKQIQVLQPLIDLILKAAAARDKLTEANKRNLAFTEKMNELRNQLALAQILDPRAERRAQIKQETPGLSDAQVESRAALEEQVAAAAKSRDQLRSIASSIGDSFGEAFKGIITGSMTVQQALAGMFQSIADSFADMAAQMIAEYVRMQALGLLKTIFGAVAGGLGSGLSAGGLPGSTLEGGFANPALDAYIGAKGGVAPGGWQPFPVAAFANGGMVTGPTLGLVGEGRYNEAIIPLPDGKSVPVQLSGGAGGNAAPINTSIVVNVKNGQAESQMSGNQGNQLARELEGAVRQVILKESRPGGLISSSR
jgi:tape measure domain-containing protein